MAVKPGIEFNTRFECRVDDLVSIKINKDTNMPPTLYAVVAGSLVKSTDAGSSWIAVDFKLRKGIATVTEHNAKYRFTEYTPQVVQISKANGVLYAKVIRRNNETAYYHITPDENRLVSLDDMMPSLDSGTLMWHVFGNVTFPFESDRLQRQGILITTSTHPWSEPDSLTKQMILEDPKFGADCFLKQLGRIDEDYQLAYALMLEGLYGSFALNGETYYMEYNYKLFRWKPGEARWYDTGVQETCELTHDNMVRGFKIAASGETVYVGKRDGQLFQSLDGGENWNDVTANLPKSIEHFNQIVLTNSTVYVATDKGVFSSIDGNFWHTITDKKGKELTIKSLATTEDAVYGANDDGIYRFENEKGIWKQIVTPNS